VKKVTQPVASLTNYKYDTLMPASKTFCRDSKAEIAAIIMPSQNQADIAHLIVDGLAPTAEEQVSAGFIDQLDPKTETIEKSESKLDLYTGLFTSFLWLFGIAFMVGGGLFVVSGWGEMKKNTGVVTAPSAQPTPTRPATEMANRANDYVVPEAEKAEAKIDMEEAKA